MKKVLCIDGGGARGIIPAVVLNEIEDRLDLPISKIFNLIVGSSVGAIIGGTLSTNRVSASKLLEDMLIVLPKLFHWRLRLPIIQPKYNRDILTKTLEGCVGQDILMKQCVTRFMCTSVSSTDGKTHFFKNWEEKDGNLNLIDTVTKSYAAPYYFGGLVDKPNKTVWFDGGTGLDNCPLDRTRIEIERQNWQGQTVHILSIGCGQSSYGVKFSKAKKFKNLRQMLFYSKPAEGGLAKEQSAEHQLYSFMEYTRHRPNISIQRLDILDMPKKMDKMDKTKYIDKYIDYGLSLATKIDYDGIR